MTMPHNVIPIARTHRDQTTVAASGQKPEYRLPEADRQAILAQAPSAQLALKIERMRREFIEQHGDAYGLDTEEASAALLQQKS